MAELIVTLRKINNIDNILSQCANNGITNFRVNLARSSVEKNSELIEIIKRRVDNARIFLDIPGNKNRICKLQMEALSVHSNQIINLNGNKEMICLENYEEFYNSTDIGDIVIFGDNDVKVQVIKLEKQKAVVKVVFGNRIKSHSGYINISNYVPMKTILETEKEMIRKFDDDNIVWDISFADTVERIEVCKEQINRGKIVAKIETSIGLNNVESISDYVDGIMLARGDLSIFFGNDVINDEIFDKLRTVSDRKSISYFVATNIFKNLATNGKKCEKEDAIFQLFDKNADYIITNETSSSPYWKEIIEYYKENTN